MNEADREKEEGALGTERKIPPPLFIDWFHIGLALRPRHGAIRSAAAG